MEWMDNLSDEIKGNDGLKKFDSVEALAKSYVNLEAMKGNSIRIAGPDASAEDKAAVYQKVMSHMPELMLKPNLDSPDQSTEYYRMLGVPESIDGYESTEIKLDDDTISELKKLAFSTNMTKAQFNAYAKQMEEMNEFTVQQNDDARTRMGAELKTEWGMAFDDRYSVVEKHLSENPDLGNIDHMTPAQIRGHYAIAKSLTGSAQAHSQPTASRNITPDEATRQIQEIMNNPLFLDGYENMQEHHRLVKRRIELMRQANPEEYA